MPKTKNQTQKEGLYKTVYKWEIYAGTWNISPNQDQFTSSVRPSTCLVRKENETWISCHCKLSQSNRRNFHHIIILSFYATTRVENSHLQLANFKSLTASINILKSKSYCIWDKAMPKEFHKFSVKEVFYMPKHSEVQPIR